MTRWIIRACIASALLSGCTTRTPSEPNTSLAQLAVPAQVRVVLDMRQHSEWTPARRSSARVAASTLESIFNSAAFASRLVARRDLQRTENLSGADILRVIRSGQSLTELHKGDTTNKPITLPLAIAPATPDYAKHDGFTDLDTGIIYVRKDWLDEKTPCQLAGLLAHEALHRIGFLHTSYYHPWLRRSVPYAVGDLVIELAEVELGAQCARQKNNPQSHLRCGYAVSRITWPIFSPRSTA